jgi:hypothetical protein
MMDGLPSLAVAAEIAGGPIGIASSAEVELKGMNNEFHVQTMVALGAGIQLPHAHAPTRSDSGVASDHNFAITDNEEADTADENSDDPLIEQGDKEEITFEDLRPLFDRPMDEAATILGKGPTTLKKICRNLGIKRWPYRHRQSLSKMRSKLLAVRLRTLQ